MQPFFWPISKAHTCDNRSVFNCCIMRVRLIIFFLGVLCLYRGALQAQFTPVPLSGFSQDVFAEGPPNSLVTTTMELDAIGSNKVMYNRAFAAFAGITAGLPDNGTLVSGADTYQLAGYTANNALFVKRGETFSLDLVTPAPYGRIRVLCFSTEGPSNINIDLFFSDGSNTNYITNYSLADWFFGTSNIVISGFGRCPRVATGPYTPDGLPSNPKFYYVDITLNCADKAKALSRLRFSNVSTSGNAPFPNAVFLAVSGLSYTQAVNPVVTPAGCAGNDGSIAINVSGSSGPYLYSWNTNPVQTGATATGLAPGTYTCTVVDAGGCSNSYTQTVPLNNNSSLAATASPMAVCPGAAVQLSATVSSGPLTSFTWTPGNLTGTSVTVNPSVTTTYTVNGSNTLGCTATTSVTVTVNPVPAQPVINPVTICSGATATLVVQSPQPGYTYNWYTAATGGTAFSSGNSYTTPALTANTTYYVDAVNTTACVSAVRTPVTVIVTPLPAAPAVSGISICPGTNGLLTVSNPQAGLTYNWYAASTGGTVLASGPSYTAVNVTAATSYFVEAVTSGGCSSTTRGAATISLLAPLPQPVVTVTNTTFTSLTFSWTAIPGATGYEVSSNGGASYLPPSSGPAGTSHTVSGLAGNTTIILQVRALGVQSCETSLLSAPVSGTTLSTKEIFVPNVFTPNGDGRNDILFVYGNYVASIQFRVFNQWGQLIFLSTNLSSGWDGKYNGQAQPVGVYAYTLKVVLQDGVIMHKKGSFNLVR